MKFGIIKERKNPPDRRVVFTPEELVRLQSDYPDALVKVESSDIRVFPDEDYSKLGIEVAEDISVLEMSVFIRLSVEWDLAVGDRKSTRLNSSHRL